MAPYRRILSPYDASPACHEDLCKYPGYLSTPPSPFPTVTAVSSQTPIEIVHKNRQVPTLVVIVTVAAAVATCFLLLTYFAFLLKYRSNRRRRTAPVPPQPPVPDDGFEEDTHTHHVWYIRTTGLDEPTIDSITICVYKSKDGLIEGTDCSVCLSEFRDGELVRLLPKCSHAFHIPCIDTWLNSHVNCPLCRAHIVNNDPSSSSAEALVDPILRADISPDENLNLPSSEGSRISSMFGIEDGNRQHGIGIPLGPDSSSPILDSGCLALSNLQDRRANKLYCAVAGEVEVNGGKQPIRRSFSLDLSSVGTYLPRVELRGISDEDGMQSNFEEGSTLNTRQKMESGSKGASLQKNSLGIERSLSSSGGMFLSRCGRGRNSILPL